MIKVEPRKQQQMYNHGIIQFVLIVLNAWTSDYSDKSMCTDNTINKCKFSYVVYSKLLYNLGHYFLDIQ